jgi:hypothetical protein
MADFILHVKRAYGSGRSNLPPGDLSFKPRQNETGSVLSIMLLMLTWQCRQTNSLGNGAQIKAAI